MIRYDDGTVRYFTSYEAKLLQTFPEEFVISGAWGEAMRQIGNAVPVKLSEILGKHLMGVLSEKTACTTNPPNACVRYARTRLLD